jgi:hypothetical protein
MEDSFATPSSNSKQSYECPIFHTLAVRTIQFMVLAKAVHAVPQYGVLSPTNCSRYSANFVSPDAKVSASVGAVSFVDDTTEAINDFTNDSATTSLMVDKATKHAQRWNDLLAITGGALEIPKCKFHLASYKFTASGAPVLDPLTDAISGCCPKINIQPAFGESESQPLEYLQASTARRTLGCYKCPSGNSKTGLQAIQKNAIEKSQIVLNSHLDA